MIHKGNRFNQGKNRLSLIDSFSLEQLGLVLTKGAQKYEPDNWRKGMAWSTVLDSLERHINEFKSGRDFNDETGLHHMAHAMCNVMFLLNYSKYYPQGDDRPHAYLTAPKIGLDIDEVLADFSGAYCERYKLDRNLINWDFNYRIREHLDELKSDKEFWMNIKPLSVLPFEPHCYITARNIPSEWTMEWLEKNNFPCRPVHTVGVGMSKIEVALKEEIEIFVDDNYQHFIEMNKNGIACFLFDALHNKKYSVGYKRINNLSELWFH